MANDEDTTPGPAPHRQPAQIPLLDDVIFNTSLPFPAQKPKRTTPATESRPSAESESTSRPPRATDLFGGSPHTAIEGPLSPNYQAEDLDATTRAIRERTDRVVDTLVAEYSKEIIERLRDELSAVLEDLNQDPPEPR